MCSYHCGNPTSKASITDTPREPLFIDAHAVSYCARNAALTGCRQAAVFGKFNHLPVTWPLTPHGRFHSLHAVHHRSPCPGIQSGKFGTFVMVLFRAFGMVVFADQSLQTCYCQLLYVWLGVGFVAKMNFEIAFGEPHTTTFCAASLAY
jgi:hypothetical protein